MKSLFSLTLLTLLASLSHHTSAHSHNNNKRTPAPPSHKRTVHSRSPAPDGLAALQLLNSTLTNKTSSLGGSPSPAVMNAGGSPSAGALAGGGASNSSTLKFPELGFQMPSSVPSSLDGWWTTEPEYAFLGFGYEVTACT